MILGNLFLHFPYHGLLFSSEMMPSQSKTVPGQKLFFPKIVSLDNLPEIKFLTTPGLSPHFPKGLFQSFCSVLSHYALFPYTAGESVALIKKIELFPAYKPIYKCKYHYIFPSSFTNVFFLFRTNSFPWALDLSPL